MNKKEIIPAIDLIKGNVVRLQQGNYEKEKIYSEKPLEIVKQFIRLGITTLHIVDLDGAKKGKSSITKNQQTIIKIIRFCKEIGIKVQLGGGLRTNDIIEQMLRKGINKIILSTFAVEQPDNLEQLLQKYPDRIIVSLDVKDNTIRTKGWLKDTKITIDEALKKYEKLGVKSFLITDIKRDGMNTGFNSELYKKISEQTNSNIIAAGGIATIQDIRSGLKICQGIVIGSALYERKINYTLLQKEIDRIYNYSTLAKRIIPCLDVKDGRVVKGVKFKNLKDAGNPVLLGKHYNKEGADELVFLDISATIEGRKSTIEVIKKVAESVLIPFAVGGGIRTIEDMETIINAGAEKVCINTAAVKTPNIITRGAKKFGSQSIIVAIDAKKKENKHWEVITHAGSKPTGMNAIAWARKAEKLGAGELLVTSMDRDGTKKGYDLELLQKICTQVNIPVIASGGAGSYEHFQEAIKIGAEAVLAASLFHYNEITIQNLKEYLKKQNIPVRIQKC